ncbi:MAG: hypothetical protein JXO44_00585 [Clostridia bacterium]|nr:hypothetical protein [Clostridia bacterium]
MTMYQMNMTEEQTMEEYEASRTNYFGTTMYDDDSLDQALNEFFQQA